MSRKPLYYEIFATSLGSLLLEISYTRIFSFKVFYYFTYLILGTGLLGIGSGGIAVAISARLRAARAEVLIPLASLAGGASVFVSYQVIARMQLNIAESLGAAELGKLLLVALLLTSSFFAVGITLSTILSRDPESAPRLYGADLLGAALGCTLCVPLISLLTPPRTVVLSGLVLTAAGLRLARPSRALLGASVALVLLFAVPVTTGALLRDPVVSKNKGYEDFRREKLIQYSRWSPVFRIDVAQHPFYPKDMFLVFHDGQPGSGMRRFDGSFKRFDYLQHDTRALPFEVLPKGPRVLIIGAAGGHEVVASLFFGASHVTGVELNPVTYSLLTDVYADITGHLAQNPKVTLLNGDGRWFLSQTKDQYDLIWFVAPDSYAAMNAATSGAFVLSESYLYTVEMVRQSFRHLSPRGIVCTQFGELDYARKPNRTARYLSTARAALAEEGVTDFADHVMVASAPGFPPYREPAVLLSKKPFTDAQVEAFVRKTGDIKDSAVHFVPGQQPDESPVNQVITLDRAELPRFFKEHPYQIDPVRDDAPFFWHFTRFADALRARLPASDDIFDYEDSIAEQLTVAFLGVVVVLAFVLLLLPLFALRESWSKMPHKAASATYFAALGLGFMFLEVGLIQKVTLLLGYPTYSLSVTLFALLTFSGIGSLYTGRAGASRAKLLRSALGVLLGFVLVAELALPEIIRIFVGSSLAVRIAVTVALVAPVGLCLGTFMPIGLRSIARITERPNEYVAWAWAVNGFFSVIASVLSTILAMIVGFRVLLVVALLIYVIGVLALSRIPDQPARETA